MRVLPLFAVLATVAAASAVHAAPLTVDGTNSPFVVNTATTVDTLTVNSGGVLVLDAPLTVNTDGTVNSGGTITHDIKSAGFLLTVNGTLTVNSGGSVDATGKGLRGGNAGSQFGGNGETLDPLTFFLVAGAGNSAGGSHAGAGAGTSPVTYGTLQHPSTFGGGGSATGCSGVGGAGGGVVHIVAGTLRVDGIIKADGNPSVGGCPQGGGGAGGSVFLEAGTFSGSGLVTAVGGVGANSGGGGRVNVTYTTRTFTGVVSAATATTGAPGGTGTSFALSSGNALTVQGGVASIDQTESFASVTLLPPAVLSVSGTVTVTAPLNVAASTTVVLESADALTNVTITPNIAGTLRLNTALTVAIDVSDANNVRPPQILSLPVITGTVGVAYAYDDDGLPAARGDRPLTWSLGKTVAGTTVGKPAGMTIDGVTGKITWTPAQNEGGKIPVTLVAKNAASAVAQDFTVDVAGGSKTPTPAAAKSGCGCSSSTDGAEVLAFVLLGAGLRRRRR